MTHLCQLSASIQALLRTRCRIDALGAGIWSYTRGSRSGDQLTKVGLREIDWCGSPALRMLLQG